MSNFLPLQGYRVLDFSKVLAGPLCTQLLADMGADVIKVEPCGKGDDTRSWPPFDDNGAAIFLAVNRNKRSLALDLKCAAGREACARLAATADVVIESFGPGVAKRLGVDYDTLSAINPRIIHCGISGFGTVGPMREGKGYDLILQAFSGMMSLTGEPDGAPARSPFSPVDQGTGMHAALGIVAALLDRARTGRGMKIEASLFDTSVGFLAYFLQGFWMRGTEPARVGSGHESLCPYQSFEALDRPFILGVANDALWQAFCKAAGRPELIDDDRFRTNADRVTHRRETVDTVAAILRERTREEWMSVLGKAGIPCSPVHSLAELYAHPHTTASGMIVDYEAVNAAAGAAVSASTPPRSPLRAVTQPLRFDGQRQQPRSLPPTLGQHTIEVLREAGYSGDQIDTMLRDGAIQATTTDGDAVTSPAT